MTDKLIILIAEDDDNDLFFLTRALKKCGIPTEIQCVPDGQYAVDYLAGAGQYADRTHYPLPHFAFFDIKMPRRTGLEALEWLREQPQFKNLPVMIISSSSEERDIKRAHALGVSSYLVKTSDVETLARELKNFCEFWSQEVNAVQE